MADMEDSTAHSLRRHQHRNSLSSIIPITGGGQPKRKLSRQSVKFDTQEIHSATAWGLHVDPPPGSDEAIAAQQSPQSSVETPKLTPKQVRSQVNKLVTDHLTIQHLKSMGMHDIAWAMEREIGSDTSAEAMKLNPLIQQTLSSLAATESPLQLLLGHRRSTDYVIEQLLADTPSKLTASAHHFFDRDTMSHLVHMANQSMWTRSPSKVHLRTGAQDHNQDIARYCSLRAATLNQLVERVTKVIHRPNVNQTRDQWDAATQFTQAFLRTYKHFCAPHTLLAKLFQRWFVPMGLPFNPKYQDFYITIMCHTASTSSRYWEQISAKVMYRYGFYLFCSSYPFS